MHIYLSASVHTAYARVRKREGKKEKCVYSVLHAQIIPQQQL